MTVGLMMVVRNEKEKIEECLKWHLPFVDEVAICDQQSDDGTFEILEAYQQVSQIPFHLWQDKLWGYCEPSKQSTADLLTSDWVLYVDPDEKFPETFLKDAMRQVMEDPKYNGYNFPRYNYFDVQVFDENVPIEPKSIVVQHPKKDPQLRLTRKKDSIFPAYLHNRVRITGEATELPFPIEHRKSIKDQWEDNRRYKYANDKR